MDTDTKQIELRTKEYIGQKTQIEHDIVPWDYNAQKDIWDYKPKTLSSPHYFLLNIYLLSMGAHVPQYLLVFLSGGSNLRLSCLVTTSFTLWAFSLALT